MPSRKEQQAELLIKFGELVAPLEALATYPEAQTPQSRAEACAKFVHDYQAFRGDLERFQRGEPGRNYQIEIVAIAVAVDLFTARKLGAVRDKPQRLSAEIEEIKSITKRNLLAIPCDLEVDSLEAGSPFTAYMKLRSLCEAAASQLTLVDPYMGPGVIRRYLHGVSDSVCVTVVTKQRNNSVEFQDFLDLSKLVASERGPDKYRLLYHDTLHDRHLRADNEIYHLGGSLKDAGRKSGYSVSRVQLMATSSTVIDTVVAEATEVFGPQSPKHP